MIKNITAFLIAFSITSLFSQEIIEDNSFLIEEAYNQNAREVQHVFNIEYYDLSENDAGFSFSQEWPLFSPSHQVSYEIPYFSLSSGKGMGDITLSYRYQLTGNPDWAASAPTISLILPTGSYNKGLGSGSMGFELLFPASKRISKFFVSHFNAGYNLFPNAKINTITGELKKNADSYFAGGSLIWLLIPGFNFMMEYMFDYSSEFDEEGNKSYSKEHILSPGFRLAIDIDELQIVPGAAVPYSFNSGDAGLFIYLSFEHQF